MILVLMVVFVLTGCVADPMPTMEPIPSQTTIRVEAVTEHKFFVPIVYMHIPAKVGVVSESPLSKVIRWHNPSTSIKVTVRGSDVVKRDGYDWSKPDNLMSGYRVDWITVNNSPEWMAQDGLICKLPLARHWWRYAEFVQLVIDRYHPKYIELWNEPDIAYADMPFEHVYFYGCIGDGQEYAQFADYIYSNVSGAEIIIGSVASPYTAFIIDMINADPDYDGLSFHCYNRFYEKLVGNCVAEYDHTTQYTNKPVYLSETAVLYKTGSESDYEQAQIEHYNQLLELPTVWYWYTLCGNGWPIGCCSTDLCRRPVYEEYIKE